MTTCISKGGRKMCYDIFRDGKFQDIIGQKLYVRRDDIVIKLVVAEIPIEINGDKITDSDRWLLFEMTTGKIIEEQIDGWLDVRAYISKHFDEITKYLNSPQGRIDANYAFGYRLRQSENEYAEMKKKYIRDHPPVEEYYRWSKVRNNSVAEDCQL